MKKFLKNTLCLMMVIGLLLPMATYAREGDCGYEGGISSGEAPNKTIFEYQEPCFVTGEPVVLKGTLTLRKSLKKDILVTSYTYNLKNIDKSATLTRVLTYNTKITKKDNGQKIEETTLANPTETVKIGSKTFTLKSYDFTRTNIIDPKPAINYYAGNIWGKKIYQLGAATGTATAPGSVTVVCTGSFYGYDQYWGTTEVETLNYVIQSEEKNGQNSEKWGGTASVTLSSTTTRQTKYIENKPDQISFDGGFVQTQNNNSILEYSCRLPEFDAKGIATDRILEGKGSLKLETFPVQARLPVPNLKHISGHWAEFKVKELFSLEVFKGDETSFNPDQYMKRSEFAAAIVQAAKEVPADPVFAPKTGTSSSKKTKTTVESPFNDVPVGSAYFAAIEGAYKRGLLAGRDGNNFGPNDYITIADAITVFIKALGLESLAPNPAPVTTFKDNNKIPSYARDSVFVAQRIGLIAADKRGYLYPDRKITKATAAEMLTAFIDYMCEGIRKDYRDRIVNFN